MRALVLLLAMSSSALAQVPQVQTDIPPVAALVAQVMGGLGSPGVLLDKGGDEHDLQLRPSQMRALNGAQLLVWIGPDLTPALDTARQSVPDLQSLALLDDPDYVMAKLMRHAISTGIPPKSWLETLRARPREDFRYGVDHLRRAS
jgi:ABC-type Zn2+ transport system substrate-binding protein/surface adhesin